MTSWYLTGNDEAAALELWTFLQGHNVELLSSRWVNQTTDNTESYGLIDRAGGLILINSPDHLPHGHHHVEAGYAMGQRKPVVLLGERENHMYHSTKVVMTSDHQEVLQSCLVLGHVLSQVAQLDLRGDEALTSAYRVIDAWHAHTGELADGHGDPEGLHAAALVTLNELIDLLESRQVREVSLA